MAFDFMSSAERLQKVLAERGIASRRGSADIIAAGRVTVNGVVITQPGHRVNPDVDHITLDGDPLPVERERKRTILFNKPRGYICSRSSGQGKTIYELLKDIPERIEPAGRLDKDSEGLLVLSNDGDLIDQLTHPRFGHEKVYRVTVSGSLAPEVLAQLQAPIEIEGGSTTPAKVRLLHRRNEPRSKTPGRHDASHDRAVLEFVLCEGRNRQVRRLCQRSGLTVHRLVRTSIGKLKLAGLNPGQWRDL